MVEIARLVVLSAPSILDDESERIFELALITASNASMREEELERLRLEV